MRRFIVSAAVVALGVGTAVMATPSQAAPHGLGCQLSGTAKLKPGLGTSPKHLTYTFAGKLSTSRFSTPKVLVARRPSSMASAASRKCCPS